jgi:hypothetical protein
MGPDSAQQVYVVLDCTLEEAAFILLYTSHSNEVG